MQKFQTINKFSEYNTAYNQDNAPETILVTGSKNVMIDGRNGKVRSRPGYSRLGAANTAETPIRNAKTWTTSKGTHLPLRMYDDEWEVYLETVDGTDIDAWTRFSSSRSTTAIPRWDYWYDDTESIDLAIFVEGTDDLIEWNGAVAVVGSIPDGTHVTKAGTTTWAQNRFYTTRNKSMVCVRTGTVYTYSAGETSTNLTVTDSTGLVVGDILVQSIVTQSNKPTSGRNSHYIGTHENQIFVGSDDDEVTYISKDSSYYDFSYTGAGRVAGEGGILTLTDPCRGFGHLANDMIVFVGTSSAFKAVYQSITVGSTLTESLTALPLKIGVQQGAFNQETIVQVGNGLIYLTNEPAIIMLESAVNATEPILHSLSNPIKPDFDAEDFTNACAIWYKNSYWLSAWVNSHTYILEFVEDADGNVRKFWQPPQVLPVRAFSIIDDTIHGHSNAVAETYKLLDGLSDAGYDDEELITNGGFDSNISGWTANINGTGSVVWSGGVASIDGGNYGLYFLQGNLSLDPMVSYTLEFDLVETIASSIHSPTAQLFSTIDNLIIGGTSVEIDSGHYTFIFDLSNDDITNAVDILEISIGAGFIGTVDNVSFKRTDPEVKFPITAVAKFAYRSFKDRANLKNFDEYYVEGEITQNTDDCLLNINYDFGGHTQTIEKTIDGTDEDILEEAIGASSLAQESLGTDSLAGLLNPPTDARKFRVIFEIAKEDFHEMQAIVSSDEVDRYWAILSMGPNATMSTRRDTVIHK